MCYPAPLSNLSFPQSSCFPMFPQFSLSHFSLPITHYAHPTPLQRSQFSPCHFCLVPPSKRITVCFSFDSPPHLTCLGSPCVHSVTFIYCSKQIMSEYMPCSFFYVWVTSLRTVFSISIQFHAKFEKSLFFTAAEYTNVYILHTFFIHSSIEGHLGCLQVLAITNNTAMNIVEQMLLSYYRASLGYIPKSGIAGSRVMLILNFLRNWNTDFQSG